MSDNREYFTREQMIEHGKAVLVSSDPFRLEKLPTPSLVIPQNEVMTEEWKEQIQSALEKGCLTNGYDPDIAVEKAISIMQLVLAQRLAKPGFVPCGQGDNTCNCKSEMECGYLPADQVKWPSDDLAVSKWNQISNGKNTRHLTGEQKIVMFLNWIKGAYKNSTPCEYCKDYSGMDNSTKCPKCGRGIDISYKAIKNPNSDEKE